MIKCNWYNYDANDPRSKWGSGHKMVAIWSQGKIEDFKAGISDTKKPAKLAG